MLGGQRRIAGFFIPAAHCNVDISSLAHMIQDLMADDGKYCNNMTKGVNELDLNGDATNGKENEEDHELTDDPDDDISPEEFEALNSQMDQLNSALDVLEEQNDIIHAKLMDLLESNRAARKQFKEEQEKKASEKEEKK